MSLPEKKSTNPLDNDVWAQRQRNNVRLGWLFGVLALCLFFLALWKYRPL